MEIPAVVKNEAGVIVLESKYLLWKAQSGNTQTVDLSSVAGMKATPPTAAKNRILLTGSSGPLLKLEFANRDTLDRARDSIQHAIQSCREPPPETPVKPASQTPEPQAAQSTPKKIKKRGQISFDPKKLLANIDLQRQILEKDKSLLETFKDTVVKGSLTNEQFWQMRMELLVTAAQSSGQQRGAYNVLSTIKPVTGSDNQINLNLTRDKIHDIFEQYPIVRKAYNECVPEISESEFWKKFFMSRLFLNLRGERVSSNHPWDPLLDKYIDEIAKRRKLASQKPSGYVPMFRDVNANSFDVPGLAPPDPTMKLGDEYGTSLIRQMNGLSKRLLSGHARQKQHPATIADYAGEAAKYDKELQEMVRLDDLEPESAQLNTIDLKLRADQAQKSGGSGANISSQALDKLVHELEAPLNLAITVPIHTPEIQQARQRIKELMTIQAEQNITDIGSGLLDQHEVDLVHATTIEFLRHFWDAREKGEDLEPYVANLKGSLKRIGVVVENVPRNEAGKALRNLISAVERALDVAS